MQELAALRRSDYVFFFFFLGVGDGGGDFEESKQVDK
jgi:hypothetical protein